MRHATTRKSGFALAVTMLAVVATLAQVALASPAAASAPVLPIPDTLWQPPSASLPATGNFVYLESDPGDYIGAGLTYLYTPVDAVLSVTLNEGHLRVGVDGDEWWHGDFQTMSTVTTLESGYYPGLKRYPFHDPAAGGLAWVGEGRGSNTLTGWFAVDSVTYIDGELAAVEVRFEQHSEGATPALHGAIRWSAADMTQPPGPVLPIPDTLWRPRGVTLPATGNYVYFESDPNDYIGAGETHLYTQRNAELSVSANGRSLSVSANGAKRWYGSFQTMCTLTDLQPGYYPDLRGHPSNPARGGLYWWGDGRGDTVTGWFVIDSVTYTDGTLASIDLRFVQHSEGEAAGLRGKIHWSTGDSTHPPGPRVPIPDDLWRPEGVSLPASDNYIYLDSDPGDYIGAGHTYLYTPSNATLSVSATGGLLSVGVNGDTWWHGRFQTMYSLTRIQRGYYAGLRDYPFHNPAKGGLDWSGDGRGDEAEGWFAVDRVSYQEGDLAYVDLRFEQHSSGAAPALHGAIHWDARTSLTLVAPRLTAYGQATFRGALKDSRARDLAGMTVMIQSFSSGVWTTVGSATTNDRGEYVVETGPTRSATYRAVFAGKPGHAGAKSAHSFVATRALVTTPTVTRALAASSFNCSCYLLPRHLSGEPAITFECQHNVSGRWVTKRIVRAVAEDHSDRSRCSARIRLAQEGVWRIRAVHSDDAQNAAASSGWRSVTVR